MHQLRDSICMWYQFWHHMYITDLVHSLMVRSSEPWTSLIPPSKSGHITDPSFWIRTRHWSPLLNQRHNIEPKSIHHDAWNATTHTNIITSSVPLWTTYITNKVTISMQQVWYAILTHQYQIIQAFNNTCLYIHKVFTQLLKHINFIHQLIKHNRTTTNNSWIGKQLEKSSRRPKTGQHGQPSRHDVSVIPPHTLVIQVTTDMVICSRDHDGRPIIWTTVVSSLSVVTVDSLWWWRLSPLCRM